MRLRGCCDRDWRWSLGRWNITVNCVAPGVVDTEATQNIVPRSIIETLAKQQCVPGVLKAEDLTGAAVYFASDEARFITGHAADRRRQAHAGVIATGG